VRKIAWGALLIALGPIPLAHPGTGLRGTGGLQLYDQSADRSGTASAGVLTSFQDWWLDAGEPDPGPGPRISFFRRSRERLGITRQEGDPEETTIRGSVMILDGAWVTLRFREERDCPPGGHHTVFETGFGLPLAGNRVYFLSGKAPSPDERLLEFSEDPFLNDSGAATIKTVQRGSYSEFRTTFHTTHQGGDRTGPADIEFRGPFSRMRLSGPLSKDPSTWMVGQRIRRYVSGPEPRRAFWRW